jgi:hypothetical protein
MKRLLFLEELALLALALVAMQQQSIQLPLWLWPIAFLSPDLGMLGYLLSPRVGAWTYNLFHHKGIAAIAIVCGWFLNLPVILLTGILLLAHSSFDRVFGYGLKFEEGFAHTHLGKLDKKSKEVLSAAP